MRKTLTTSCLPSLVGKMIYWEAYNSEMLAGFCDIVSIDGKNENPLFTFTYSGYFLEKAYVNKQGVFCWEGQPITFVEVPEDRYQSNQLTA
jgi:hypothetical protein